MDSETGYVRMSFIYPQSQAEEANRLLKFIAQERERAEYPPPLSVILRALVKAGLDRLEGGADE